MKASKAILPIIMSMFLLSFASAAIVSDGAWSDNSQEATITAGENIDFWVQFFSQGTGSLPMTINVKLYDSANNEVYSFLNNYQTSTNPFFQIYTITPEIYAGTGNYELILLGSDNLGSTNSQTLTLTVNSPTPPGEEPPEEPPEEPTEEDTTAPVITLTGSNPQIIVQGNPYIELGATATDDVDGDLTGSIIIDASAVNTAILGLYAVTYSVSDSSGNTASVSRLVNVMEADTTAPVINLTGDSEIEIYVGETYTDAGATATDDVDEDLTIIVGGDVVDTDVAGTYIITYDVTDSSGNEAVQVTRTVHVLDEEDEGDEEDEDDEDDGTSGTIGFEEEGDFYEEKYLAQNNPKTIYLEEDEDEKQLSWFQKLIKAIVNFFKRLFGIK